MIDGATAVAQFFITLHYACWMGGGTSGEYALPVALSGHRLPPSTVCVYHLTLLYEYLTIALNSAVAAPVTSISLILCGRPCIACGLYYPPAHQIRSRQRHLTPALAELMSPIQGRSGGVGGGGSDIEILYVCSQTCVKVRQDAAAGARVCVQLRRHGDADIFHAKRRRQAGFGGQKQSWCSASPLARSQPSHTRSRSVTTRGRANNRVLWCMRHL